MTDRNRAVGARAVDVLRLAVLAEGGEWTPDRAIEVLAGLYQGLREDGTVGPQDPTRGRARVELNRLVDEGLLVRHGKIGTRWTLTEEAERRHKNETSGSETSDG